MSIRELINNIHNFDPRYIEVNCIVSMCFVGDVNVEKDIANWSVDFFLLDDEDNNIDDVLRGKIKYDVYAYSPQGKIGEYLYDKYNGFSIIGLRNSINFKAVLRFYICNISDRGFSLLDAEKIEILPDGHYFKNRDIIDLTNIDLHSKFVYKNTEWSYIFK